MIDSARVVDRRSHETFATHKITKSISVQRNTQSSTHVVPPRQTSRQRADQIVRQRERLIAEVQDFNAGQERSESAQKAQQLLTRWWAKADWKAREELLKAAEWLIEVEKQGRA